MPVRLYFSSHQLVEHLTTFENSVLHENWSKLIKWVVGINHLVYHSPPALQYYVNTHSLANSLFLKFIIHVMFIFWSFHNIP